MLYSPIFLGSGHPNNDIANFNAVDFPVEEFPDKWIIKLSKEFLSPIYPKTTADNAETIMNSSSHLPYTSSLNIASYSSLFPLGLISYSPL